MNDNIIDDIWYALMGQLNSIDNHQDRDKARWVLIRRLRHVELGGRLEAGQRTSAGRCASGATGHVGHTTASAAIATDT